MKLVIVESPTKARKLADFLGAGYQVESSVGHVADLAKSRLSVDVDHNFAPLYEVSADKEKIVKRLQNLAAKAEIVYLASDPDREGEAIAWHVEKLIKESLSPVDDKDKKSDKSEQKSIDRKSTRTKSQTKTRTSNQSDHHNHLPQFVRATFHEITPQAVQEAIDHPGQINLALVDAQQARRVLDRLVGYKVSPVLWRKVRRGLSAGRVQSVALRLIVEREKEITAFVPEEYWEIRVNLTDKTGSKISITDQFEAQVIKKNGQKYEPKTQADVQPVTTDLEKATYQVLDLSRKTQQKSSYPPFTTSTLQQAAATRLGYTSKQTMSLAQQLYEEGLITYHRTDSFNLSAQAVAQARHFIEANFGTQYVPEKPRIFAKKSKNAQEAHEAIRVTKVGLREIKPTQYARFTASHAKLYDLIWRRFMASQMSAAIYDQTAAIIAATPANQSLNTKTPAYTLKANGSILKFDGWMSLFSSHEDKTLPALSPEQILNLVKINPEQKFTQPPARYNDASIIKELEARGIGRPSTYASIISLIVSRGYVERQQKKFFATPVGITVSDFLMKNLDEFMQYDFTAQMEDDLDAIAAGKKQWQKVVGDFYWPFEKKLEAVGEKAERVAIPVEKTGEKCPLCGQTAGEEGEIVIRSGRYGKFKSCSRYPDCKYTENLTEKVADVKCPVCREGDVVGRLGRFGKFYSCSRYPDCDWRGYRPPKKDEVLTAEEWETQKAARAERAAKRRATMEAKKADKITKSKAKAKPKKSSPAKNKKKAPAKKAKVKK